MGIADERLQRIRHALADLPAASFSTTASREAAVALVIRPAAELEILLIKRAERAGDPWSGHMAFPGGTRRAEDPSLTATAFRETEEETGVALTEKGLLLGALHPVTPMTVRLPSIVIAPFVVAVPGDTHAEPDRREVVATFWIPLAALRDETAVTELLLDLGDRQQSFPSLRYGDQMIWGLTHRILSQFLDVMDVAGV
jgi:8-oxo-dGTP pyrophosphatase MutT (NUDIX family)